MYASGRITLGDRAGMAVPASALVLRDGREFVFTVDAENRALETKVETGRRKGNLVEVVSGLKPGQSVIATGAAFLNNGDLVRVTGATGGAAAAGGNAT
jgi:hypothetical protein